MLSEEELGIENRALAYAKKNRTSICRELTDKEVYLPEECPVSVFMSGSPGAGKTEFSTDVVNQLETNGTKILRLDPDELRDEFEEYDGSNSYLFQRAVSLLIERSLDYIYKNKQSFLLDGTLASYNVAEKNIKRSLDKKRNVLVLFVFQRPELAWQFVEAREKVEGRKIKPEHFVAQYFGAQEVIQNLKENFGKSIRVDVVLKDNDGKTKNHHSNVDSLAPYLKPFIGKDEVEKIVGLR
jgi:predicted ABC-type ATPase